MITIQINKKVSYPVFVLRDIWPELLAWLAEKYTSDTAFLILDGNVEHFHGKSIRKQLASRFKKLHDYVVRPGETSKSVTEWNSIVNVMLENNIRRNTPVLVFGGGVTGDLAGFAAASVLRGVPLIHCPTTLLAMVDSSIGGKTGVNHETGKNLIGSFYQPDAVFAGLPFLETLPEKEWLCGLGEIIKYGAIARPELLDQTYELLEERSLEPGDRWEHIIEDCMTIKGDIVSRDEKEHGIRSWLNFGHTFAHAIETLQQYKGWSHGEAVYAGMLAAAHASNIRNAGLDMDRLLRYLKYFHLNVNGIDNKVNDLVRLMYKDKKIISGNIRLILLEKWGEPVAVDVKDEQVVRDAWNYLFAKLTETRFIKRNN